MLQEDSNGETGFEFVDKKIDELSVSGETAGSLSSMSSSPSLMSSPGGGAVTAVTSGNLLSNVPPPSELPSFISSTGAPVAAVPPPPAVAPAQCSLNIAPEDQFYPTQFSPAIPPSKGAVIGGASETGVLPQAQDAAQPGVGLLSWMKDAVSSGGILSRVAERAKSSVDSMITTLDPQMREFIYSGGDVDILVASDKEAKISPIREAFQAVFGKATVSGINVQPSEVAAQPVGFAAGIKAAEERIAAVYTAPQPQPMPVLAIESFLLEVGEGKWHELAVLLLSDPARRIHLQTFTQTTPVPSAAVHVLGEDTPADYPLRWSGYSQPIGNVMARNLNCERQQWQQSLCGVSRRETILLAARTLAGLYKTSLQNI